MDAMMSFFRLLGRATDLSMAYLGTTLLMLAASAAISVVVVLRDRWTTPMDARRTVLADFGLGAALMAGFCVVVFMFAVAKTVYNDHRRLVTRIETLQADLVKAKAQNAEPLSLEWD